MLQIKKNLGLTFDDVLLVPQKTKIESRTVVDLSTKLSSHLSLSLPICSANMDTVTESDMAIAVAKEGGIGFIHRFLNIENQIAEVKKVKKQRCKVGAAIGIRSDYKERCSGLIKAGADSIVLDIAHGHSVHMIRVLKELVKLYPYMDFIAGNVATAQATADLITAGAKGVKVGIGPGSLCTTRIISGAGVPQLTAISECSEVAREKNIPIIADGGIQTSGNIVKALAAGASSVMIGSLFAGCEESPALSFFRNNKKFKMTRGMASLMANKDRANKDSKVRKDLKNYAAEGVEAVVPYRGFVCDFVGQLVGGIKSGFSYCGAQTIKELWKNAEFIQITQSSLIESRPHDVDVL